MLICVVRGESEGLDGLGFVVVALVEKWDGFLHFFWGWFFLGV